MSLYIHQEGHPNNANENCIYCLEAQVKELKAENERLIADNSRVRKEITIIETGYKSDNSSLRDALKKYGRHLNSCGPIRMVCPKKDDSSRKCACGLDEACGFSEVVGEGK